MKKIFLTSLICLTSIINAQQFIIKGKVVDKPTSAPLSYANIRVANTTLGTASTFEGIFELRLNKGNYKLITSFLGYKSDTISVTLNSNKNITFSLEPVQVHLKEITVLPGENPAIEIIRRAINAKHQREEKINTYEFRAYTKGIAKTTKDIVTGTNSVGLSIGTQDTGKLKITGIIENESKGYFKKPNYFKDEILARKQSANTSSTINILTGGRIIQNFYTDDIQFFNRPLPSPISDDAIDYYDFLIEDTLAIDRKNVFQIHVEPLKKINPGFIGKIFIEDRSFYLVKLDVKLNDAANPGRIFNTVNIFQQYTNVDKDIYMPVDYRVFAEGSFLGLLKFGFELNTIFFDYTINTPIDDDKFGMAIIKVEPDADKKDSTYWKSTQTIANTAEELQAYKRIDSLEAIPKTFWDKYSFLSPTMEIFENVNVTNLLGLYSFNPVEGHTLNFGGNVSQLLNRRFSSYLNFSYGFADQKFKTDFNSYLYLGEYRTHSIAFRAYHKLTDLFGESIRYNDFTSTLTSLFGKYDIRNYYYSKGFSIKFWSEVFPVLHLSAGFFNRTDNNAFINTDFSILNRDKVYSPNSKIFETKINALTFGFQIDPRKYIENGYSRIRTSQGNFTSILYGEATLSNTNILSSSLDFQMYRLTLSTFIPTFKSASMNIVLGSTYSEGPVPIQMMNSLPGNIESVGQSFTFRTLRIGEVFGDQVYSVSFEHNFNDELFRFLNLSFLINAQISLSVHFNAAISEISPKSKIILPSSKQFTEFKSPFYEIGFGIGQALFPFRLEFTWKLNYFGSNDFVIGLNTPLL